MIKSRNLKLINGLLKIKFDLEQRKKDVLLNAKINTSFYGTFENEQSQINDNIRNTQELIDFYSDTQNN